MRTRLDQMLLARGLTTSRARARDLIKRGEVRLDGRVETKAARMVDDAQTLHIRAQANRFVARSGAKLDAAIKSFEVAIPRSVALDIGASTGGFTQVLLDHGANYVYAVDVGRGQLHPDLIKDPRVCDMSGIDARTLDISNITRPITGITADVSFISLTKALPAALKLAQPGCWLIALVKPQFELGPKEVAKDGVVKNEHDRQAAVANVSAYFERSGWHVDALMPSPLPGKRGNIEHLLKAHRAKT